MFLSETRGEFNPKDEQILSNYSLIDIYKIQTSDNINEDEQKILDLFESYYKNNVNVKEVK